MIRRDAALTPDHDALNALLERIAAATARATEIEMQASERISHVRAAFADRIAAARREVDLCERQLTAFARKRRDVLFAAGDRVSVPAGSLMHKIDDHVIRRAKGVLANLERLEWTEAIKVSKSVDWDVLDTWPDDKLAAVGTERKRVETFPYELEAVRHER